MSKKNRKTENREIMQSLVLVLQVGINMLVPIFACSAVGVWLGDKLDKDWMMLPFFLLGALAGGNSVYKLVKKRLEDN